MSASTEDKQPSNPKVVPVDFVDSADPMDVCKAYLLHRGVSGKVIFAMLTGSQAYNLVTPTSDKDYLGTPMVTQ